MRRSALALPLLTIAALACQDSGEPNIVVDRIRQLHPESDQIVMGLEHYITAEGVRKARIEADTAFFIADKTVIELRFLTINFFGEDGTLTSIMTAEQGTYDWSSGDMTARIDVVVVNPAEGRRILTSVMHYDKSRDRIWSDQHTKMFEDDGTIVEGSAFDSDANLTEVNLTNARMQQPGEPAPEP